MRTIIKYKKERRLMRLKMKEFDKNIEIDFLIKELISTNERLDKDMEIPKDYEEKRKLLRALMNTQIPVQLSDEFYEIQDKILSEETSNKDLVSCMNIEPINQNGQMLGCFIPLHNCIDNQIHSAAGFQLRMDCYKLMQEQGHEEPNGNAKITSAYNLPSKYVIHTVGPAIAYGQEPNEKEIKELESCYKSCLELAEEYGLKSIAFCSISTGVFNFPKDQASKLAIEAVRNYLMNNPNTSLERIIFNTFSDEATEIYRKNLK